MTAGTSRRSAGQAVAAAVLAIAGIGMLAASFELYRPAPAVLRLLGVTALTGAGLAFAAPAARRLVGDAIGALRGDRTHLLALAGIVVIGIVVRAWLLDLDLRFDESYTYLVHAVHPIGTATGSYPLPNNHLLNTVLTHVTTRDLGLSPVTLRLPAFAAGVALPPAVYAAGRLLHTREVGLIAAGLAAVSAPLVAYSANARGYSMSWLALAVLLALSARLLERRDLAIWSLWVFTAVLGLYAVPTTALGLATVGVWLAASLILARQWRRLVEPGVAAFMVGLLVAILYWDLRDEPGWDYVGPPIPDVADFVVDTFASLHDGAGVVLTVLFALLVAAGLVLHRRTGRHPLPVALVALLLVPLLAVALPQVPPFQRSWSYLAIFEVIVIAAGVVGLAKLVGERRQRHLRRLGPALVGCGTLLLGIVVSIGAPPGNEDPPVLGARATLRALAQENPQAPLVVSPFSFPSFAVSARLEGYGGPLLVEAPDPALPPALLAVSRSRGETPQAVMEFDGFGPNPPAVHFERRIGEVDLYRFGS